MKTTSIRMFVLASLVFMLQGCGVAKQVGEAYNLVQCKYDYNSISRLSLGGIDLSRGIGITTVPQVIALLAGDRSSVPMNFTINLDVSNPNQNTAFLHGLEYILKIDGIEFTRGSVNESLSVPSGSTKLLPLAIGVDLATLLSGGSKNAVENIVKNFVGIGNEKSSVSLQIKPFFRLGSQTISAPQYIPVNFSFGGK